MAWSLQGSMEANNVAAFNGDWTDVRKNCQLVGRRFLDQADGLRSHSAVVLSLVLVHFDLLWV